MQHLILLFFLASFLKICTGADWCYQSQFTCDNQCKAPDHWKDVNGDCGMSTQSPINIVTRKTLRDENLTPFKLTGYQDAFSSTIKNNGHTVQVGVSHLATVSGGDLEGTYKAVQFHLHWGKNGGPGSEHTIDGEQYPMELHIVHMKQRYSSLGEALKDPTGVAVLGFFYEESRSPNRKYDGFIHALKRIQNANANTSLSSVSLGHLTLSEKNMTHYYRYKGSLTTPGCTESVVWTVFQHAIPLSREQLQAFSELKFHNGQSMVGTFRPVLPLNGRRVYRSGSAVVLASGALLMASFSVAIGLSLPN